MCGEKVACGEAEGSKFGVHLGVGRIQGGGRECSLRSCHHEHDVKSSSMIQGQDGLMHCDRHCVNE